jgi:hypothetical protein
LLAEVAVNLQGIILKTEKMNNGKQPITPSMWTKCGDGTDDYQPLKDGQKTGWETKFGGLTKREYLASKAMQGLLSNPSQIDTTNFE